MKKLFTLFILALLPLVANAADPVKIDGIYYNLIPGKTNTAVVTYLNQNQAEYSGEVVIPTSVTYNKVTYSVTSIGREAFYNCSGLTSVTIPNSVTSIGSAAFYGCSGLTSITIPNSVTSIGGAAFKKCSGLISVTIGKSVTSIEDDTFRSCISLTSVTIPNSVTSIGNDAFYNCSGMTSVTIPNSVTSIGHNAFDDCSSLTSVTIPNSVTSIGGRAFGDCSSLTSVTISNSVNSIESSTFQNCISLTSVTIPNGVKSIGWYAFSMCSGLTSVTIPNSVTSIGDHAFSGCSSLTSMTIPNGVTSIDDSTFDGCSGLTSVTIPNSVISIGSAAFYGCCDLPSVTIPNGVKSIGEDAFYKCSSLTSVTIPNGVTSIGAHTFAYCSGLTSASIPNSVTSIGDMAFYKCSGLTSVTIPNSVTSIGSEAFRDCSSLTSVTIPNSVTSINSWTFSGCGGLTSVTIGNSVTSIGYRAFSYCSSLTDFYSHAENVPETNANAFYSTKIANATLHVPAGSVEDYNSTEPWSGFGTIVAIGDNPSAYVEYYDGTLTFYYDNLRNSRKGTTYNLNKGTDTPLWNTNSKTINKVVFDSSFANARPTSTFDWFLGCNSLEKIEGITYLNTSSVTNMGCMFKDCSSLTSVDLSHFNTTNVTNMALMFWGCSTLTSLDLSSFDTGNNGSVGSMFNGCSNLSSLTLGTLFTTTESTITDFVFFNCTSLKKVTFTGDIPAKIKDDFFESVGSNDSTATLIVPGQYRANYAEKFHIYSYGSYFYGGCFILSGDENSNLKDGDIFVHKTCEGVDMTFKVISMADKTIQVGTGEENASAIDKDYEGTVTIPDEINGFTVDEIGHNAFVDCKFSNIVFPSTLTTINGEALLRCMSLKSIFIPRSVKYIAPAAFASCTAVESIVVEEGNQAYDSREGCNAIIVSVYNVLQRGCKTTIIPSGIEKINFAAFQWTPFESGLTIPEGVTNIGQAAFYHTTMTSVSLPSTLTYIGGWSFQDCDGLENIGIPNGVTYIGDYAFSFCDNLNRVIIPASVTEIGTNAFNGNDQLKVVVSYITEPRAIADDVFMNNNDFTNATLYVPFGTKAIYEATDGWKNFKNIVEMNATDGDITGDGNVTKEDIAKVESEILEPAEEFNPNKDVNRDGVVNVADIVEEVNIIKNNPNTGSGYFWLGTYFPKTQNFPTVNGKEVEGIVTTYKSLDDAMAKASRAYSAGEYAVVLYPSSWGAKDGLVFYDAANKKYYALKKRDVSDFPDYTYYESVLKIGANTTITLSTEAAAKAAGATEATAAIL